MSSDCDDRMGAKFETPKKSLDQKETPQKSHAEFCSTLFAELRARDTQALENFKPKEIPSIIPSFEIRSIPWGKVSPRNSGS